MIISATAMSDNERLLQLLAAVIRQWIMDGTDDAAVAAFLEIKESSVTTIRDGLRKRRRDNRSCLWS